MNGDAAGWVGLYPPAVGGGTGWFHGREGAGVSIVLDVVPIQDMGAGRAGESLGSISHTAVAKHFHKVFRVHHPRDPRPFRPAAAYVHPSSSFVAGSRLRL
jgi:hypothetical protein